MAFETVLYEVKERIVRITLNRPGKRNALNKQLWDEMVNAFEQAEEDRKVRVIILTGAGKDFCGSFDLKDSYYFDPPEGEEQFTTRSAQVRLKKLSTDYLKIFNVRKPTIAQVSGHCLAAGVYLPLLCDVAIAAEDAVFGHPASHGPDSMPLFVWHMGLRKAKEFLMTRRMYSGKEAEQMGLVNRAVPADQLEEEVWKMAKDMATTPTDIEVAAGEGILKEMLNTDAEIMGLGALFRYHRQLNAMAHIGLGRRAESDVRDGVGELKKWTDKKKSD